jgi:hypothetical protein
MFLLIPPPAARLCVCLAPHAPAFAGVQTCRRLRGPRSGGFDGGVGELSEWPPSCAAGRAGPAGLGRPALPPSAFEWEAPLAPLAAAATAAAAVAVARGRRVGGGALCGLLAVAAARPSRGRRRRPRQDAPRRGATCARLHVRARAGWVDRRRPNVWREGVCVVSLRALSLARLLFKNSRAGVGAAVALFDGNQTVRLRGASYVRW